MANDEMLEYLWRRGQNSSFKSVDEIIEKMKFEINKELTYYKTRYREAHKLKLELTEAIKAKNEELARCNEKIIALNEELRKKTERGKRMWVPHREYVRVYQECKRKGYLIETLQKQLKERQNDNVNNMEFNSPIGTVVAKADHVTIKYNNHE